MGRDKALLDWGGEPLVVRQARVVASVTGGHAVIVGAEERYGGLGFPVVEDLRDPGQGPLAGIEAALASPYAGEWNLIVACDMPRLDQALLERLLAATAQAGPDTDCILCMSSRGPEPLCSLYRRRFVAVASRQLDAGERRVRDALDLVEIVHYHIDRDDMVANVNTPAEWEAAAR